MSWRRRTPSPAAQAVTHEEKKPFSGARWSGFPDAYREPMILFYREQQSGGARRGGRWN